MIKVIAIDLVGVLVTEKDIDLTKEEDKLERMLGSNTSDIEYINKAKSIINDENEIIKTIINIFDKLYLVKDKDLLKKIKNKYPNIKIIIATNHVSFIRRYLENIYSKEELDDIIISAEINRIKPNKSFYNYILDKYNIIPSELLFIDDSIINIDGASILGINTIKVEKNTNILEEIDKYFK